MLNTKLGIGPDKLLTLKSAVIISGVALNTGNDPLISFLDAW